ncbi:MAG: HepT-like ribonuclease domain-containing protein [Candidatus Competibacteraceae bacterium]
MRRFKARGFLNIPWREITGFRNILVHNYSGTLTAYRRHSCKATSSAVGILCSANA